MNSDEAVDLAFDRNPPHKIDFINETIGENYKVERIIVDKKFEN